MSETRLIERWLPIAALGIESTRERTPMTPFPAPNRLHVWWARRPLVASRAAILASLLPADADREKFMHVLGIHGDPVVATKRRMQCCQPEKQGAPGSRMYMAISAHLATYVPDNRGEAVGSRLANGSSLDTLLLILDPTAGGGSIPFEVNRIGLKTQSPTI